MKTKSITAFLAGLAFAATPALAAPLLIDDFSNIQRVADQPSASLPNASELASGTAIGGARDLHALSDAASIGGTEVRVENDFLGFSNIILISGTGFVTWDGFDGDATNTGVNTTGLGGIDVTDGATNDAFVFDIIEADANVTLTFTVFDMAGAMSSLALTFSETIAGESVAFFFNDFVGSADFTNVGAIQLSLGGGTNLDVAIDRIFARNATVPVPAAIPLFLLGLSGVAFARRRLAR